MTRGYACSVSLHCAGIRVWRWQASRGAEAAREPPAQPSGSPPVWQVPLKVAGTLTALGQPPGSLHPPSRSRGTDKTSGNRLFDSYLKSGSHTVSHSFRVHDLATRHYRHLRSARPDVWHPSATIRSPRSITDYVPCASHPRDPFVTGSLYLSWPFTLRAPPPTALSSDSLTAVSLFLFRFVLFL